MRHPILRNNKFVITWREISAIWLLEIIQAVKNVSSEA